MGQTDLFPLRNPAPIIERRSDPSFVNLGQFKAVTRLDCALAQQQGRPEGRPVSLGEQAEVYCGLLKIAPTLALVEPPGFPWETNWIKQLLGPAAVIGAVARQL
jgi:hypothetical protein